MPELPTPDDLASASMGLCRSHVLDASPACPTGSVGFVLGPTRIGTLSPRPTAHGLAGLERARRGESASVSHGPGTQDLGQHRHRGLERRS
jgi:hypothetical protein